MPIYEYKCLKTGEIAEQLRPISDWDRKYIVCPIHTTTEAILIHDAERIISLPAPVGTPDDSKSSLTYYQNRKGEVEFSSFADKDKWQPNGYERREARNLYERESIEKKIRNQDNSRLARQREKDDINRHYTTAERHSELRQKLREGQMQVLDTESGRKETVSLDERGKDLLKKGMEYSNNKRKKRVESEFRFSVNHDDKGTINNKE